MNADSTRPEPTDFPETPRLTPDEAVAAGRIFLDPEWSRLADDWPLTAVDHLEARWAAVHGADHAIAVSSGTTALTLVLQALGIPSGDEVLIPAYGCPAVDVAVWSAGLTPIHVDLDPTTYCMSPSAAAAALTSRTAALIAVHFAGQPARLRTLASVAERQGIALIQDACQAPGATYEARPLGAWGTAAVFSLGVRKPISAGEGGLITTNDAELARKLRESRGLGADRESGDIRVPTGNHRLSALQAAVALPQLARLAPDSARRERAVGLWAKALGLQSPLQPLSRDPQASHSWAQYWLRLDSAYEGVARADLLDAAHALGIPLFEGWSRPNYTLGMYAPQQAGQWLSERGSGRDARHYERTCCPNGETAAFNEAVLLDFSSLNAPPVEIQRIAEQLGSLLDSAHR